MRTIEVTREFRDRCKELAEKAKMPEVRARLWQLFHKYQAHLEKLESPPLAPR
jgi:hypothetical protein